MSSISCKSNFLPKQWRKHLFMNQTWVLRYYRLYLTKKSKASRFWIKILLPGYSCGFPFCHSYSNNDGSRYPKSDFGYLVYSLIFSKPFLKIFLFRIVENRSIFVSFDQYSLELLNSFTTYLLTNCEKIVCACPPYFFKFLSNFVQYGALNQFLNCTSKTRNLVWG